MLKITAGMGETRGGAVSLAQGGTNILSPRPVPSPPPCVQVPKGTP